MNPIEIDQVVVRRRGFHLGPATLDVAAGQAVALVGPNGAGKSTLLGAALGLVPRRAGSVRLNGRSVTRRDPPQDTGALLALSGLLGWCDARTNLRLVIDEATADDTTLEAMLESVGLGGVGRKRVAAFSTGMVTRLCIARALVGNPQVLVLDEPTAGLDAAGVGWLADTLVASTAAGVALLVASHDEDFVVRLGATVVGVRDGQLAQTGPSSHQAVAP